MTARWPWLIAGTLGLVVIAIVVIPCLILLQQSLQSSPDQAFALDTLSLANFAALIDSRAAQQAFMRTLRVSFFTTLFTIVAGYPLALFIASARASVRGIMLAVLIVPFLLSAVVRAYGWNIIIGDKGMINSALLMLRLLETPLQLVKTEAAVVIGETHLLTPYMVLSLLTALRRIDPNLVSAAKSLGASPLAVFINVTLPMTVPGLVTGTLLVFGLSVTAFATPLLLGGTTVPVLTTLLYRYAYTLFDWSRASAVAVVLIVLGAAFMTLHRWISRRILARQDISV